MKTTPKAADTSYHIQTRENTWQTVGQMKSALERPVTRRELLDLDKRFHAALNHVTLANSGAVRDISQSGVNPIFEQDLIAMQADVSNLLSKLNSSFPQQEQSLVTTLFTQKWTDLIFGELADQLTVSCLEQGVLLQKLRVQYANNSQCLVTCYKTMVHKLVQAQQTVHRLTGSYEELLEEKKHLDQTFEKKQALAIAKLTEAKDQEISNVRDEMDNLQALNDNMRTSLRTLNGIFSSMRGNQEAVRIGDLREANNRLQQMLVHKDKELESLRPLVDREKHLQTRVNEQEEIIEDLKVRLLTITNKLNDQSVLNKELISKESDRLESLEKALRKTKEKASHNPKGTQEDLDNMAQKVSKSGRGSGKGDGRGNGKDGSLCVRCKRTLEASRNLDMLENHLKADLNKLPCTAFRILLPNLMGFRPERTNEWVIRCMRAIVFANQRANSLASRIGTKKMRMPEFVYAWFHPRPQDVMKGNQDEVMAQADEHRWGFYYGVKKLAKNLHEARLFYSLLNETFGEDDNTFFMYCLQMVRSVAADDVDDDWGSEVAYADDYTSLMETEESNGGFMEISEVVWVTLENAMYVVERVMSKSMEKDRDKLHDKLVKNSHDAEGRIEWYNPDEDGDVKCLDASYLIYVLIVEYRNEQAARLASLKVMFQTASLGAAEEASTVKTRKTNKKTVDLQQFMMLLRNLNSNTTVDTAVTIYRDAHEYGRPGVDVESFLYAAELNQFFTSCQRMPTFYGALNSKVFTEDEKVELRFVVSRHVKMFSGFVNESYRHLSPKQANRLHGLQSTLDDDLQGLYDGGLPDPLRLLYGFRRLLDFLLAIRCQRLENLGEPKIEKTSHLLANIDTELTSMQQILNMGGLMMKETTNLTERLKTLMMKLSATRIQRNWKRRLLKHPLPLEMRRLMSLEYAGGRDPLVDTSLKRRAKRPVKWVLSVLRLLYSEKYDEISFGDTPAADHSLLRWIYNFFLHKFGSFHLAELHLHDFFTGIQMYAATQPSCQLFQAFVTKGKKNNEPEFGEPEALQFYLEVISALNPDKTASLFPKADDKGVCYVNSEKVFTAIKKLFGRREQGPLVPRLKVLGDHHMDLDHVCAIIMEAWRGEVQRRERKIQALFRGATDINVLNTFKEFNICIKNIASQLKINAPPVVSIDTYISAVRFAKKAGHTEVDALVSVSRSLGFVFWKTKVDMPPRPSSQELWLTFLKLTWQPFKASSKEWTHNLEVIAGSGKGVLLTKKDANMLKIMHAEFLTAYKALMGKKTQTVDQLSKVWESCRDMLQKLSSSKKLAGRGSQMEDSYWKARHDAEEAAAAKEAPPESLDD